MCGILDKGKSPVVREQKRGFSVQKNDSAEERFQEGWSRKTWEALDVVE